MTKASKPAKMATTSKAAKPETLDEQHLDTVVAGAIAFTASPPLISTSGNTVLKGAAVCPC